ncbi:MAG: serine hydrolase [Bacteroidota bacterium]
MKNRVFAGVILAVVCLIFLECTFYSPRYIFRVLTWQDADYDDFRKFDFKEIKKGAVAFNFYRGTPDQEEKTIKKFEEDSVVSNLGHFLKEKRTRAFIVIRNDTILYESYFFGNNRASMQTSFSVSKSILSLLIGIAIKEDKIKGVEDRITEYIPELLQENAAFHHITIRHLLKMQSGIAFSNQLNFPFVNGDPPKTYHHPNLRRVALKHSKIENPPGDTFNYNNYNALLLGLLLERATGQSVSQYLEQKVWRKIGMQYDASWSTDKNEFEKMESGLNARALDYAKIGRLVLKQGHWNGNEIIPSKWIEASTQKKMDSTYQFYGNAKYWTYNYFWWGFPKKNTKSDIMAIGRFGQFIYISPSTNTIIIRNGEEVENFNDRNWVSVFKNFLD